jgi:hypothetical protein
MPQPRLLPNEISFRCQGGYCAFSEEDAAVKMPRRSLCVF